MAIAATLRKTLDYARGYGGRLGLRPFTVTMRVRTWSGSVPGEGAPTDVDTVITVAGGTQPVKCEQVSSRDIFASGGLYTDADWKVGPFTPLYSGGGFDATSFDPPVGGQPTEVFWILKGRDLPPEGALHEKIGSTRDSALHYYIVLRATGRTP